jgi:hypothetical protein
MCHARTTPFNTNGSPSANSSGGLTRREDRHRAFALRIAERTVRHEQASPVELLAVSRVGRHVDGRLVEQIVGGFVEEDVLHARLSVAWCCSSRFSHDDLDGRPAERRLGVAARGRIRPSGSAGASRRRAWRIRSRLTETRAWCKSLLGRDSVPIMFSLRPLIIAAVASAECSTTSESPSRISPRPSASTAPCSPCWAPSRVTRMPSSSSGRTGTSGRRTASTP